MRRIQRILVLVQNTSAAPQPAVTKAGQLASALRAELTILQVTCAPFNPDEDLPPRHQIRGALDNYARSAQEAALRAIARGVRRRGVRVAVSVNVDCPRDEAILGEAQRSHADLIVVEARPRPSNAALLGLTDWDLLRRSPVPVLLVKRAAPYRRPKILLALDPDHTFGKPQLLDAEILHHGAAVSRALRGSLHAVYAYAPEVRSANQGAISTAILVPPEAHADELARRKLARATRPTGICAAHCHVSGRHVPDAIEQIASDIRSAIVVLGAVSRTGPYSQLIGNTAERLIDRLACDILVVKPHYAAKPVAAAHAVLSSRAASGANRFVKRQHRVPSPR